MAAPSPEAYARVRYLYESLTPKPPELLEHGRYYVREGPLLVWDENRRKKSKRYIFLLNNALLITKRDGRTKFWLRVFISLNSPNVLVENMTNGFDYAFRLQVTPKPKDDFSLPVRRSFVFFTNDDVESWIEDVSRSINSGNTSLPDELEKPKSSKKSSPSRRQSSSRSSSTTQPNFNFFTDGDYSEDVKFDSGVKLGGIRSPDRSTGDAAVPVLAPPPGRGSTASLPLLSPPPERAAHSATPTAQPATKSTLPSLDEFLSLTVSTPTTTSNNNTNHTTSLPPTLLQPQTTTGGGFDFLAPTPVQTTPNSSASLMFAPSTTNTTSATMGAPQMQPQFYAAPQTGFNPFASPGIAAAPPQQPAYNAYPNMMTPTSPASNGTYASNPFAPTTTSPFTQQTYTTPAAVPMQPASAQPFATQSTATADPFAGMFGAPPTAAGSKSASKPVDFF